MTEGSSGSGNSTNTASDNVKSLIQKAETIPLQTPYSDYIEPFSQEQWYKNIVKSIKGKQNSVLNLINENAAAKNPKLIILGDIFYSMNINCAALQSFVQEICDEFDLTTDVSSAMVKKLTKEGVVIFDTSTYKIEGKCDTINDDWKMMIKQIVTGILNESSNHDNHIMLLTMGAGNNMISRDLITNGVIESANVISTGHPSPKAAHSNFRNSNCFKETNQKLMKKGLLPVRFGVVFT